MPKGGFGIQSLILEMPLKSYYSVLMVSIPSEFIVWG
jgi:hypothetical protein